LTREREGGGEGERESLETFISVSSKRKEIPKPPPKP